MRADGVGVIGLGHMGQAVVRRFLAAQLPVHVHDLRPEATSALVAEGAIDAGSAGAMADAVATIIVCVDSEAASLAIAEEVAGGSRLRDYVETSTIGPDAIGLIDRRLAGASVVDAPVSGGPHAISEGRLSTYLAGAPAAIDRVRSLIDRLASTVIVVGDRPGMAQIAKLVNNAISLSSMVISCEAITVGVAAGLDPQTLLDAVNAGTGRNSATLSKIPTAIMPGSFDYGGPVGLAEKDLGLYRELAASVGIDADSTLASAQASIRETIRWLGPAADYSEMIRVFESATGVRVRSTDERDPGQETDAPSERSS